MKIIRLNRVVIAYPSGNTTAIVFDDILPCASFDPKVADAALTKAVSLLLPDIPPVEQCCSVKIQENPASDIIARADMFGGEFCGNAARSAVRALTYRKEQPVHTGTIEISGASSALRFTAKGDFVHIEMPLPSSGCSVAEVKEGSLVRLEGITHLVITDSSKLCGTSARSTLTKLLREGTYGLDAEPAAGVSYYDEDAGTSLFCVWVKKIGTMYDETGCGSGTCAIGAVVAAKNRADTELTVIQPSGAPVTVKCDYGDDGLIHNASIAGTVDILYDGPVEIEV
jgi:diaminopimelate epimerase